MNVLFLFADYTASTSDYSKLGEYGLTGVILGGFACLVLVIIAVLYSQTLQRKWDKENDSEDKKAIAEYQLRFVESVNKLSASLGVAETKIENHETRITRLEERDDNDEER